MKFCFPSIFSRGSFCLQKPALIILLFIGCASNIQAQNLELINQLRTELKGAQGESRFKTLNAIGWEYRFSSPDSTIWYANQAYQLGVELKLKRDLARSLNYMGIANNYKGERIKAYESYNQALALAAEQNDSTQIAHANNNLGRLFFEQGVLEKSYKHFIDALGIFKSINDLSGIAYTYQSLGNLYQAQKDFAKSGDSFLAAYRIREKLGNKRDIMSAATYLGGLYQAENKIGESSRYFMMADSLGRLIGDEINMADVKIRLAENYLKEGKLAMAQASASSGYDVIVKVGNKRLTPSANLVMGKIAIAKNNFTMAKKYFDNALRVSIEIKDAIGQMNAYYQLAEVAKHNGQKQLEIDLMNHYLVLNDSIKDLEVARQVERLQFKLEIDKKEKENDLLKIDQAFKDAVIAKQSILNIGLLVMTVLVSIILFFIWNFNRKNKLINHTLALKNVEITRQQEEIAINNKRLFSHNQQLSELNHEKDMLMSIVAHDLRSPLNRISGLSHLIELTGGLSTTQLEYLEMIKKSTKAGADLITDLLDVNSFAERANSLSLSKVNLHTLISERIGLMAAMAVMKAIEIELIGNFPNEFLTDGSYIARIMDNLLTNAVKFSHPKSKIIVSSVGASGFVGISVKDQGQGFSEEDKKSLFQKFKKLSARPTGGESSNGLGLVIVKTLVDRLGGKIELVSTQSKGAEFIVRIPAIDPH